MGVGNKRVIAFLLGSALLTLFISMNDIYSLSPPEGYTRICADQVECVDVRTDRLKHRKFRQPLYEFLKEEQRLDNIRNKDLSGGIM